MKKRKRNIGVFLPDDKKFLGAEDTETVNARQHLACVLLRAEKLVDAESELRAALEAFVRIEGPDHPNTLGCRANLGVVLMVTGKPEMAEKELRASLDAADRVLEKTHPRTLHICANLAACLAMLGKMKEAETLALRAYIGASGNPEIEFFEGVLKDIQSGKPPTRKPRNIFLM